MNWSKIWLALLVSLFLNVSIGTAANKPVKKVQAAQKFFDALIATKWDEALKYCDTDLAKAFANGKLKSIWHSVISENGEYRSRKVMKVNGDTVYLLCCFEKFAQLFRLPMSAAPKLIGFWTGRQWPLPQGTEECASFDGFKLTAKIELPENLTPDKVKRAIVLVHGSGPQSLDGTNLQLFQYIASALRKEGFATIRYNKRSFQVNVRAELGELDRKSKKYKDYDENFIHYFIKDAAHMAKVAQRRFSNAKIYLFGHSQGARLALYAAKRNTQIVGLALFGLSFHTFETGVFEQRIYRFINYFDELDTDGSKTLNKKEAAADVRLAQAFSYMDMNGDGLIDKSEFKATNFSNSLAEDWEMSRSFSRQTLELAPLNEVIKETKLPMLILQGDWDHQVQSYQAKALKLINDRLWKKKNMQFIFFPKLGHVLNVQKKYFDFDYKKASPKDLAKMAKAIANRFAK